MNHNGIAWGLGWGVWVCWYDDGGCYCVQVSLSSIRPIYCCSRNYWVQVEFFWWGKHQTVGQGNPPNVWSAFPLSSSSSSLFACSSSSFAQPFFSRLSFPQSNKKEVFNWYHMCACMCIAGSTVVFLFFCIYSPFAAVFKFTCYVFVLFRFFKNCNEMSFWRNRKW